MDEELLKMAFKSYQEYVGLCLEKNMDGGEIWRFPKYANLIYVIDEEVAKEYFLHVVP